MTHIGLVSSIRLPVAQQLIIFAILKIKNVSAVYTHVEKIQKVQLHNSDIYNNSATKFRQFEATYLHVGLIVIYIKKRLANPVNTCPLMWSI